MLCEYRMLSGRREQEQGGNRCSSSFDNLDMGHVKEMSPQTDEPVSASLQSGICTDDHGIDLLLSKRN